MTGPDKRARVLLVDDDTDLRESVSSLLVSRGHQVVEAAHGQLALDALAADPGIDLIILDLMMPQMDGFTFLANKARGAHAAIPVVIFSSSQATGLDAYPHVVSVIPKLDGIDGLLAAIRLAHDAGEVMAPPPVKAVESSPARAQARPPAVRKLLTGIRGFDEITEGGLPRGRTKTASGTAR